MSSNVNEVVCSSCGHKHIFEKKRWRDLIQCKKCGAEIIINRSKPKAVGLVPEINVDQASEDVVLPPQVSAASPSQTNPAPPATQPAAPVLPPGVSQSPKPVLPPTQTQPGNPIPQISTSPGGIQTSTATQLSKQRKGGNLANLIILAAILMLVVGGLGVAYLFVGNKLFETANKPAEKKVLQGKGKPSKEDKKNWTTAKKQAAKLGHSRVEIEKVIFSPVRGKDASNVVQTSGDTSYLHVYVKVKNNGADGSPYLSWYGNLFEDGVYRAELYDQDDNEFEMMVFEDITAVSGHVAEKEMAEKETLKDVIIFELPEGIEITDVEELYCRLPGQAVNVRGEFKFKIPSSMIIDGSSAGGNFNE